MGKVRLADVDLPSVSPCTPGPPDAYPALGRCLNSLPAERDLEGR